ncbi:MAG: FAD-dependent oxidoreductase, partial [Chloroflexota bacterium]
IAHLSRERLKSRGVTLACTVNPSLFREREFVLEKSSRPKRVIVAGGGLAGMEAARVMAERGHEVTLYERSQELGGQWNIACLQREKAVLFGHFRDRLVKGLKDAGVTVNLGQAVDRALVEKAAPEVVVVATGARPATLPVPGADGRNVVQGVDVIRGQAEVGDRVVVAGARYLGMEVAISLAEQGKTVSLVTRSRLGRDVERNTYLVLRGRLEEVGVRLYPNSPVYEIRPNGVYVAENQELLFLEADTVVLAVGARSENGLWQQLRWVVPQLYAIGDCAAPRDGFYAVREGAEIGRSV